MERYLLLSVLGFAFYFILIALYLIPAVVAWKVNHKNKAAVILLNIFLGWTVIGWVGALVWAAMKTQRQTQAS